jgi:hypothetical protein
VSIKILPDRDMIARTVATLRRDTGIVELRGLGALRGRDNAIAGYYDPEHIADLVKDATSTKMQASHGIYLVLNQINPALLARSANRTTDYLKPQTSDVDIIRRWWLPIDTDAKRPAGISASDTEHKAALQLARKIREYLVVERGWPERSIVCADSGNGGHLLVACDEPNDDATRLVFEKCLKALAARFDSESIQVDTGNFNAGRIFKLYGTVAKKGDDTPDRPHRLSKLLYAPPEVMLVTRQQLEALAAEAPQEQKPAPSTSSDYTGPSAPFDMEGWARAVGLALPSGEPHKGGTKWQIDCPFNGSHKSPDAVLYVTATGAAAFGCSHNSCKSNDWRALRELMKAREQSAGWSGGGTRPAPNTQHSTPNTQQGAPKQSATRKRTPAPTPKVDTLGDADAADVSPQAGLVSIQTVDRPLPDITADGLKALLVANSGEDGPTLFSRDRGLVQVVKDRHGRARIHSVGVLELRGRLARVANWVAEDERGNITHIAPPRTVVEDLLVLPDLAQHFPLLEAIVAAPVVGPSGELVTTPGYLPDAAVYYQPADDRELPDTTPTDENLTWAKDLLLNRVLKDFPFADKASKTHALALILLPFLRPYISGATPLHLIDAPVQGSGKSLLAETCLAIATGEKPGATYCPSKKDEDEWRKLLGAALGESPQYVWLDNLKFKLDSGALALAITAPEMAHRRLGTSDMERLPVRCAWVLTGNNIQLEGDFPRRSIWIRLDSQEEKPEDRSGFTIPDLGAFVWEQRPDLVAACVILLRRWIKAGRPHWDGKPIGGFGGYCRAIGGVMNAIGETDFLANREDLYDRADPERERWQGFVGAWWERWSTAEIGVEDLIEIAIDHDIVSENTRGGRVSLGTKLRQQMERVYGGKRIRQGKAYQRVARYYLESVGGKGAQPNDLELKSPPQNTRKTDTQDTRDTPDDPFSGSGESVSQDTRDTPDAIPGGENVYLGVSPISPELARYTDPTREKSVSGVSCVSFSQSLRTRAYAGAHDTGAYTPNAHAPTHTREANPEKDTQDTPDTRFEREMPGVSQDSPKTGDTPDTPPETVTMFEALGIEPEDLNDDTLTAQWSQPKVSGKPTWQVAVHIAGGIELGLGETKDAALTDMLGNLSPIPSAADIARLTAFLEEERVRVTIDQEVTG